MDLCPLGRFRAEGGDCYLPAIVLVTPPEGSARATDVPSLPARGSKEGQGPSAGNPEFAEGPTEFRGQWLFVAVASPLTPRDLPDMDSGVES